MKHIEALYQITLQLHELLMESKNQLSERDEIIEKVNELLTNREAHLKEIKAPYNEEEMAIGKKIIVLDAEIKTEMEMIFQHIQTDMKKVKEKKVLNRSYINPYGNIKTTDGMYLDSKQ